MLSHISCKDENTESEVNVAASFFAMIFISQLPLILRLFNRKNSRDNLLILFRMAADPTFLGTVTPSRDFSYFPGQNVVMKNLFWTLFPIFAKCKYSDRFKSRSALVNEWFTKNVCPLQPKRLSLTWSDLNPLLKISLLQLFLIIPFFLHDVGWLSCRPKQPNASFPSLGVCW